MTVISEDKWEEIRDLGGAKAVKTTTEPYKYGYFKRKDKQQGPAIANEYIAAKLADLLSLPAASIRVHTLDVPGYISLSKEKTENWGAFPFKDQARQYLSDPSYSRNY